MNDTDLKQHAARIEALVKELDSNAAPEVRERVSELLQSLLQLYGEGLGRILALAEQRDPLLPELFAQDELIAHLLYLHDLHPIPLETRVASALDDIRPSLQAQGAKAELNGLHAGMVSVRLIAPGGCASASIRQRVEEAVRAAAPDLATVEVAVEVRNAAAPDAMFIPLSAVSRAVPARG